MIELVEMEMRDLLKMYGFSEDTPMIAGSALCALEDRNPELGRDKIVELMKLVDE